MVPKAVHFLDEESSSDNSDDLLTTARSSPMPTTPTQSNPYSDTSPTLPPPQPSSLRASTSAAAPLFGTWTEDAVTRYSDQVPSILASATAAPSHSSSTSPPLFAKYTDEVPTPSSSSNGAHPSSSPSSSFSTKSHSHPHATPPIDETSFYPPKPLKSTYHAREAQFELDSDDLEAADGDDDDLELGGITGDDEEPLMEGLLQSSARRQSGDYGRGGRRGSAGGGGGTGRLKEGGAAEGDESEASERENESEEMPDWLKKGAGVMAGIANMSNSILGAGIIGLPYALREAGFFSGLILLVILGGVTDWTIRLIVLNAKMSGRNTYIDIMDTCFGARGRAAVSFFQFAFAFGGMCAFCVILGDTIPHVLVSILPSDPGSFVNFLISRQFVTTALTLGVSYPLSLYRDIEKLSKASALALVSMVVIVVSVAVRGPAVATSLKGPTAERWTFISTGFFEAIGVISFAFVCHHNSLLIYGSLRTPTLDRFARVTHISTALSVFACLCMSVSGYLVFTDRTQGNILNNFPQDDTIINIARACFGANMFATLPLEAFVCREVMETYFWPGEPFNQRRHIIITTSLVLSALFVSLITCDLGLILELAGGFSATALAYIFPAACYLRLSGKDGPQARVRLAAWACAGFGVCVMVFSSILSIIKAINSTEHKQC